MKVATFLLLLLIENAFKYSSSTVISHIHIDMNVDKKEFHMTVENSFAADKQEFYEKIVNI